MCTCFALFSVQAICRSSYFYQHGRNICFQPCLLYIYIYIYTYNWGECESVCGGVHRYVVKNFEVSYNVIWHNVAPSFHQYIENLHLVINMITTADHTPNFDSYTYFPLISTPPPPQCDNYHCINSCS
jgi:hypothetical protein